MKVSAYVRIHKCVCKCRSADVLCRAVLCCAVRSASCAVLCICELCCAVRSASCAVLCYAVLCDLQSIICYP